MTKRKKPSPIVDEWQGCYPSNWTGVILPEAMSHPAKYSSKLIRRIYEHAQAEGWIKPGDKVIDPFGGVGLGSLDAMRLGLHWTGIELERRFIELGGMSYACPGFTSEWWTSLQAEPEEKRKEIIRELRSKFQLCPSCETAITPKPSKKKQEPKTPQRAAHIYRGNIPLWLNKFSRSFPNFGTARLLQGDSRRLLAIVQEADLVISSPPYEGTGLDFKDNRMTENGELYKRPYMDQQTENYGRTSGQLGSMPSGDFDLSLSSPPYITGGHHPDQTGAYNNNGGGQDQSKQTAGYGQAAGQLGQMNPDGFDLSISSPPFLQSSGGIPEPKPGGTIDAALHARHLAGNKAAEAYGQTEGQLSDMDEKDFQLAISSPPYQTETEGSGLNVNKPESFRGVLKDGSLSMGDTPGNLANEEINSFWLAARAIVDQTFAALRPGGHAVWVVKGYVKNKKFVDFPDQWRQLCEAAGFVTIHEHRASLVHHKGTSITLEGEHIQHKTESKSFFRRVYEGKGGHRIDFETVFCMVKP